MHVEEESSESEDEVRFQCFGALAGIIANVYDGLAGRRILLTRLS